MKRTRWLAMAAAVAQLACSCIARGSKVKTPSGERPIEDLVVGDEVVVVDPQTLEVHVAKVSAIRSAKRECARLNQLRLTSAHPLFDMQKNEWAPAGDWILGARTEFATVNGPQRVTNVERFVGIDDVFDLTVDHPLHTFVADGVVVHNKKRLEAPCRDNAGAPTQNGAACSCSSNAGIVECVDAIAWCNCAERTGFSSRWQTSLGSSDLALRDGETWSRLECAPRSSDRSLSVGFRDDRRFDQTFLEIRDGTRCVVEHDIALVVGESWGQLWFFEAFSSDLRGLVSLDGHELLGVSQSRAWIAGEWSTAHDVGWNRYEWRLEVVSPTTYRVWPRLTLSDASMKFADAFVARDGVTSLEAWYRAGNTFAFDAAAETRVLSLGRHADSSESYSNLNVVEFALNSNGWIGD